MSFSARRRRGSEQQQLPLQPSPIIVTTNTTTAASCINEDGGYAAAGQQYHHHHHHQNNDNNHNNNKNTMINRYSSSSSSYSNGSTGMSIEQQRSILLLIVGVLLIVAPWIHPGIIASTTTSSSAVTSLVEGLSLIQEEYRGIATDLKRSTEALRNLRADVTRLEMENAAMAKELVAYGDDIDDDTTADNTLYAAAEELEDEYIKRIDQLRQAIKNRSEKRVKRKYGGGPFRVNVTLQIEQEETEDNDDNTVHPDGNINGRRVFPPATKTRTLTAAKDAHNNTTSTTHFNLVIETAPLSLMPHAIDHFLRTAIEQRLWDGMSMMFHQHAGPVIVQTVPIVTESGQWDTHRLDAYGTSMGKMAFTEHAVRYPVGKYSVVFAGQPGGPDFFINMEHRSKATDTINEGESCFGTVVEGQDILDRLVKMKQYQHNSDLDIGGSTVHPHPQSATGTIGIKSIRLSS